MRSCPRAAHALSKAVLADKKSPAVFLLIFIPDTDDSIFLRGINEKFTDLYIVFDGHARAGE